MSRILLTENTREYLQKRFLSKILKNSAGCWIWFGALNRVTGYGYYTLNGKMALAHRISYILFKEEIPKGLQIDHICNVKSCVNPDHLEPVTALENRRRAGFGSFNSQKMHCPKGHEYTSIIENVGGCQRKKRICKICIRARAAVINGILLNVEPASYYKNNEKFKKLTEKQQISPETLTDSIVQILNKFSKPVFQSALKIRLYSMGLDCYSPRIVQANRWIMKNLSDEDVMKIAVQMGIKITNTKLRKKIVLNHD